MGFPEWGTGTTRTFSWGLGSPPAKAETLIEAEINIYLFDSNKLFTSYFPSKISIFSCTNTNRWTFVFFILISRLHFWTKLSMKLRFQQKSFPFLPNIFAANYTEQQKSFNCKKASFLYFCVFCARNIFLRLFSARSYCLLLLIFLTTWVLHNRENITKYFIMYMPITESYYI